MKVQNSSVNHIFIFCDNHDEVAEELIDFGFVEGSNRVHPNQGTQNRKFYFNNFYLEVLWVHDIAEVTNEITTPTKLYERSQYASNGYSPFGLCLNYSLDDDTLFDNCLAYRPSYLPKGMTIEVLTNENVSFLPWTFRWCINQNDAIEEAVKEDKTNKLLTKVCFYISEKNDKNLYLKHFDNNDTITFKIAEAISLMLEFDDNISGQTKVFSSLPLSISY